MNDLELLKVVGELARSQERRAIERGRADPELQRPLSEQALRRISSRAQQDLATSRRAQTKARMRALVLSVSALAALAAGLLLVVDPGAGPSPTYALEVSGGTAPLRGAETPGPEDLATGALRRHTLPPSGALVLVARPSRPDTSEPTVSLVLDHGRHVVSLDPGSVQRSRSGALRVTLTQAALPRHLLGRTVHAALEVRAPGRRQAFHFELELPP